MYQCDLLLQFCADCLNLNLVCTMRISTHRHRYVHACSCKPHLKKMIHVHRDQVATILHHDSRLEVINSDNVYSRTSAAAHAV